MSLSASLQNATIEPAFQNVMVEDVEDVSHVHKQFKHPAKRGRATVPHPKRDIPIGTLKSIKKQAGIKLR